MKQAILILHECLPRFGARVVNVVHDELVVETPDDCAREVQQIVDSSMKDGMATYLKKVPVVVDSAIAKSWAKT